MRKISFIALSLLALTTTAQNDMDVERGETGYLYTISGKAAENMEGQMVYFIDQNTMECVDSCSVQNGRFEFVSATAGESHLYEININRNRKNRAYAIVDPRDYVEVDLSVRPAVVTGGLNDKLVALEKEVAERGNAVNAKMQQLQAEGKSRDEIYAIVDPEIESIYALYRKAIDDNKDNMLGAYVLGMVAPQFYPSLESLEGAMTEVKYAEKIASLRAERDGYLKAAATQPGKMFVDFGGFTVDGKPSRLSDYVGKGKYVLVDFWASWCAPCRGEIPNLVELHNKFGGDKFTVLGVNVWDDEASFKAALTKEGIAYPQIYIPRDNKDNATDMYGIKGIPQIILFAPDGTIVQRDLRGSVMKALVEEKMK